jgi:hypothetical protein
MLITELFAREGMHRAKRRCKFAQSNRGPLQYHRAADNDPWAVALLPGRDGWTIIQTVPFDLFCERAAGAQRIRLASLTEQLGCHALTYNMYNRRRGMMIEATPSGEYALSGFIENPAPDGLTMDYYDEPHGGESYEQTYFRLLQPDHIASREASSDSLRTIEELAGNPYPHHRESPTPVEITRALADALGGPNADAGSTHTLIGILLPNEKLHIPGGRVLQFRRE